MVAEQNWGFELSHENVFYTTNKMKIVMVKS